MKNGIMINELGITDADLEKMIAVIKTGDQLYPVKNHRRRWEKNILENQFVFECIGSLYMIITNDWEMSFTTTIKPIKGGPKMYVISREMYLEDITFYGNKDRFHKDAVIIKLAT